MLEWFLPLAVIYIGVILLPEHIASYALVYEKVLQGEYLRFLSYQFTHLDMSHLAQNLLGLGIICMLFAELHMEPDDVFTAYILTGIFAVLPLWFFAHSTVLGASSAVYGGFGIALLGSLQIPMGWGIRIGMFIVGIGIPLLASEVLQIAYHLSGFFMGMALFTLWQGAKKIYNSRQQRILESAQ